MKIIQKNAKRIEKLIILVKKLATSDKSFFELIGTIYDARKYQDVGWDFLLNTNYINNPNSFMYYNEYFARGMALNDYAFREVLNNKKYLFKRLPDFMKRGYLVVNEATDEEIVAFVNRYKKVAGKCNLSGGHGFKCYCLGEKNLSTKIRVDGIEILEEWIEQHEEYAKIHASSVNTLRIHTLRTTEGCQRCLTNQLSIGSGGAIHNMPAAEKPIYDLLIADTGEIKSAKVVVDYKQMLCDKHRDSGYEFVQGATLPYVKEALALCLKAAEKIPEYRYLAWDIAFTPDGPIIVEANVLSGALETQQIFSSFLNGKGLRAEIIKFLDKGMEGIAFDKNCNLRAVAFVDFSYLEGDNQPNTLQQFLLLLESAVHNYGVEFFNITQENANCTITYAPENNTLKLGKGTAKACLELPKQLPDNIYEADKLARKFAEKVYNILVEME